MDTTVELNGKRGQTKHRAYGLILVVLVGLGALVVLTALSRDTSAQVGAKGGGGAQPVSGVSDAPDCGLDWSVVSSPNTGDVANVLKGVAAISANDVWAVGFWESTNGEAPLHTLALHWNGSTWSLITTPPNLGTYDNVLGGVAAVASNDVWAVGYYYNTNTDVRTLILHWNGSTWSIVTSPNQGTNGSYLSGVVAVASNDVWAVGYYYNGTTGLTLTEHWNGSTWNVVSSPNQGPNTNYLSGVAAAAANDVWAVGSYLSGTTALTLTEHWNGSAWSVVSSPNQGTNTNSLPGVAALASNDVWAVGVYDSGGGVLRTLTEHWNGSTWNIVSSPNPGQGTSHDYLGGVAAVSANDVWAVGSYSSPSVYRTLIEHWDGSAWNVVYSPSQSTYDNVLVGVDALSANDVWAVGTYNATTGRDTLTEHYNPCTGTPTPVPTACPIQFTDVAPGSTYYDYVRCLACRQIVGGYNNSPPCTTGTPCFLPGNNVTRGQEAKFISKAANYQDVIPSTQQTFTDVAPNSTFWIYIERVYLHGVVSGYQDPSRCPTGVPCYLPGNNVTRGQAAHFISKAANYQDPIPPNQQTFTDVSPSHTFWQAIERVYMHGIVSGYQNSPPCTTGTPCYLPGNSVTRGQTAKFVSKAFFPDCDTP